MLRIGFDAKRLFNNFTGLGNYSRSLVTGLSQFFPENEYNLFSPRVQSKTDTKEFLEEPYKIITPAWESNSLWRSVTCTKDINELHLDIFHGLSHELPIGIKKTRAKSLVTIHDLIYKTYPNDFNFVDRKIYDFKFRYACENSDRIIAVSKSTKADIQTLYGVPSDKIDVVYQSCHPNFKKTLQPNHLKTILEKYKLPEDYILYVGSIIERKNLLGIVKALNKIKDQVSIPLVVVGKGKEYKQKVQEYITANKLESKIIFTSEISYLDLPAIYQSANLFIYPSKYEGFGIPIIEALWSKTPVITSNISSLPEAAGKDACFCKHDDENSIADTILKVLNNSDYSESLVTKGFEHVQQFESIENAKKLMSIYNKLLQQ